MSAIPQWIDGINRHESEFLYDEIFVKRTYLRHNLRLPPEAIVFDVGANIGMFSLFVSAECPTASIHAFEPLPPMFSKLERNTRNLANPKRLFCCGLSDGPGEVPFTFYPGYSTMSTESAYADTAAEKAYIKRRVLSEPQQAAMVGSKLKSLDALLDYQLREVQYSCRLRSASEIIDEYQLPRIDFLKIDVQRAEVDVLNGIRDAHWPRIRQIAMEIHDEPGTSTQGRLQSVYADLGRRGFEVAVEHDEGLDGTDRHALFAWRSGH
jgi:FkbM family methyltransferase